MIETFIRDVLGVDSPHPGLYGETSAYYGSVEQQGRLALHLHMLLWLKGALRPEEIRKRILDPNSDFRKKMISWLESVHTGDFQTGTFDEVAEQVKKKTAVKSYKDPTQTLPEAPKDESDTTWDCQFKETVDDLLLKSNVHNCEKYTTKAVEKERTKTVIAVETTSGGSARPDFQDRFIRKQQLMLIQEPST
jgi:hypothetical protein